MHRPVMPATKRDRELIADLAAECAGLGEAQVVGIRGLAAAHETCLLGDIAQVLPVAIATRSRDRQLAAVGFEWARAGSPGGEGLSHWMN
jgi:hypothetical protein